MNTEAIIKLLEDEAAACRETSENPNSNPAYSETYWAIHLVLESLARRIKEQP